jgi:hypothetical protein
MLGHTAFDLADGGNAQEIVHGMFALALRFRQPRGVGGGRYPVRSKPRCLLSAAAEDEKQCDDRALHSGWPFSLPSRFSACGISEPLHCLLRYRWRLSPSTVQRTSPSPSSSCGLRKQSEKMKIKSPSPHSMYPGRDHRIMACVSIVTSPCGVPPSAVSMEMLCAPVRPSAGSYATRRQSKT